MNVGWRNLHNGARATWCPLRLSPLMQYNEVNILLYMIRILGAAPPTPESLHSKMQESVSVSLSIFLPQLKGVSQSRQLWLLYNLHVFQQGCGFCCDWRPGCTGGMPRMTRDAQVSHDAQELRLFSLTDKQTLNLHSRSQVPTASLSTS